MALDAKGRFLAMRATNISNVGARCVSLSPLSKGAGLIPGSYAIPATTLRAVAVFTNTMPTQRLSQLRTAGSDLCDRAAGRRRRRPARHRPHRAAPQEPDASGGHAVSQLRSACSTIAAVTRRIWTGRWISPTGKDFRRAAAQRRKRGKLLGLGLANYVESSIGAPREQARIKVQPQIKPGRRASTSLSARSRPGRATRRVSRKWSPTCFSVPAESVRIILGDTDVVHAGGGTHSGRSMRHAATVFSKAAVDLIARARQIAAVVIDTAPDNVTFDDGRFGARDTNRRFDFLELANEAGAAQTSRGAQGRHCGRHRQRDARTGVSQRHRASAKSRSIPTPARWRSRATPRSTTSAAASIP